MERTETPDFHSLRLNRDLQFRVKQLCINRMCFLSIVPRETSTTAQTLTFGAFPKPSFDGIF